MHRSARTLFVMALALLTPLLCRAGYVDRKLFIEHNVKQAAPLLLEKAFIRPFNLIGDFWEAPKQHALCFLVGARRLITYTALPCVAYCVAKAVTPRSAHSAARLSCSLVALSYLLFKMGKDQKKIGAHAKNATAVIKPKIRSFFGWLFGKTSEC